MQNSSKKTLTTLALLAAYSTAHAWQVDGFEQPESAVLDARHQRIIVSNINGHPAEADGNGYLSVLSFDGKLLDRHWVEGLDAPKGLAIHGDELLVSDLTKVHRVDLSSGQLLQTVEVDGAQFLNDISSDGEQAYISDMVGHVIYRYANNTVEPWLSSPKLPHPNGLLIDGDNLLVATWGAEMQPDFSTKTDGGLFAVDRESQLVSAFESTQALGNLDGIVARPDGYWVNDWITGELWTLDSHFEVIAVEHTRTGLADIGGGQGVLLMPYMQDGILEVRGLGKL
ncbi:MAG: hypothetical protein ACPGSC_14190 [Granulosicoccaceae bacterium]